MARSLRQPGTRCGLVCARYLAAGASLLLLLTGCRKEPPAHPVTAPITIQSPLGLPPLPIPASNPPTAAAVALGRELFYETRLSGNNSISCASCHNPSLGFTDGRPTSPGSGGISGTRNAPTLLDVAFYPEFFWDGRAKTLEEQAGVPISDPIEMNQAHSVTVSKVAALKYKDDFTTTFGPGKVTIEKVEMALASFERTLLSGDSPFDRYEYGGDKSALTPAAVRGFAIFLDPARGNCMACHSLGPGATARFTDDSYHNLGVGYDDGTGFKDPGRFAVTHQEADRGAFRTPTLRNVAITGPYMHDGSLKTLRDVVDFYAGGGNSNPGLDKNIRAIHLDGRDRQDLVAFLESLTGGTPANVGPLPAHTAAAVGQAGASGAGAPLNPASADKPGTPAATPAPSATDARTGATR